MTAAVRQKGVPHGANDPRAGRACLPRVLAYCSSRSAMQVRRNGNIPPALLVDLAFRKGVRTMPHEGDPAVFPFEFFQLLRRQAHGGTAEKVVEMGRIGRAGDGRDPGSLGQEPGDGELGHGASLRSAQLRIRWGRGMLCFRASGVNCGRVDRRPVVKRLFSSMAPVRKPRPRGQ